MNSLSDNCINWPGKLDKHGYGCLTLDGEKRAHRAIYKLFVGKLPNKAHVLHSCDNPRCVNPNHLSLGTHVENMQQRNDRCRTLKGMHSPNAKLTKEGVLLIRNGASLHVACAILKISKSTYYRARNGESYSSVLAGTKRETA